MKRLKVLMSGTVLLCLLTACFYDSDVAASRESVEQQTVSAFAAETVLSSPEESFVTEPIPQESTSVPETPPSEDAFVRVSDYIPQIVVDLKYATTDNFTGQIIYRFSDVYLRYGTVKKLMLVQQELQTFGLSLKIWDGFRPPSAQHRLWEICPNPTYVANPLNGFSSHSRGNTVDVTLVDSAGRELEMPTGYDDFSALADRDYSDCSHVAAENARFLEDLMEKYGFRGYYGEWWHYTDTVTYEVEESFIPE